MRAKELQTHQLSRIQQLVMQAICFLVATCWHPWQHTISMESTPDEHTTHPVGFPVQHTSSGLLFPSFRLQVVHSRCRLFVVKSVQRVHTLEGSVAHFNPSLFTNLAIEE